MGETIAEVLLEALLDMLLEELDEYFNRANDKKEFYNMLRERLEYLYALTRERKMEILRKTLGIF